LKPSANENACVSTVSTPHVTPKVSIGQSRYQDHIRSSDIIRPLKFNLDIYLEDDVYVCQKDENGEDIDTKFEALAWWKFNVLKYPHLV
jgi:hypothetical protein